MVELEFKICANLQREFNTVNLEPKMYEFIALSKFTQIERIRGNLQSKLIIT